MSLGDHLEELRARLILAILGLAIGAVVSLIFGTSIIRFIEKPYLDVMKDKNEETVSKQRESAGEAFVGVLFEKLATALASDPNAPDLDPKHVAFFHKVLKDAIKTWTDPADPNSTTEMPPERGLQVLKPAEGFISYMKISFISGLILTCPWVFYQLWMFVAAGLYPHERKYVKTAVPFSAALFIIGALFFLFLIAPLSLKFFLIFDDLLKVASNWTLQGYISFVTMLMLVFGLAFQTPIAIFILVRTHLVSLEALRGARQIVFLAVFVIAALATPPDVISQVSLAVPLFGLYELGILLGSLVGDKEAQARAKANAKLLVICLVIAAIGWLISLTIWVCGQAIVVNLIGATVTELKPFIFSGWPHCLYEEGLAPSREAIINIAGLFASTLAGLLGLLIVPFKRLSPKRVLYVTAFLIPLLIHSVEWMVYPILHMVGRAEDHTSITFITQTGFQPLIVAAIGLGLTVVSYRLFRKRTQFKANLQAATK